MAQGLAITDENGRTFFDTSKTTWNFVAYLVAPADQTSSWIVSDIDYFSEITITRSYLNVLYGGQETFIHTVTRNGTRITASGGNTPTAIIVLGR
jgi:hypothetical protein